MPEKNVTIKDNDVQVETIEAISPLADLFEETLVNKNREKKKAEDVLTDKIIGFYFSAGWSPPCIDFVSVLGELYQELVEKRKAQMEIVFVSCDKSEEEMFEYMESNHANWWAVPFGSPVIT